MTMNTLKTVVIHPSYGNVTQLKTRLHYYLRLYFFLYDSKGLSLAKESKTTTKEPKSKNND